MAIVNKIDDTTLDISVSLEDALVMVNEAARNVKRYAHDITTIYEKMPEFAYTYFCFYAYDSAVLFENMLGIDPKEFLSFSLHAPDSFFYTLYGGMASLYEQAKEVRDE